MSDKEVFDAQMISTLEDEVKRFADRDGNATIELCYSDGDDPFARETLVLCDFGVSDNIYVVESKMVPELQDKLSALEENLDYTQLGLSEWRDLANTNIKKCERYGAALKAIEEHQKALFKDPWGGNICESFKIATEALTDPKEAE